MARELIVAGRNLLILLSLAIAVGNFIADHL